MRRISQYFDVKINLSVSVKPQTVKGFGVSDLFLKNLVEKKTYHFENELSK